jgi:hypothetical protein
MSSLSANETQAPTFDYGLLARRAVRSRCRYRPSTMRMTTPLNASRWSAFFRELSFMTRKKIEVVQQFAPGRVVVGLRVQHEVVVPTRDGQRVELDRSQPAKDLEHRIGASLERARVQAVDARRESAVPLSAVTFTALALPTVPGPCVGNCDESHHPHEARPALSKQCSTVRESQVEITRAPDGGKSRCHLLWGRARDA